MDNNTKEGVIEIDELLLAKTGRIKQRQQVLKAKFLFVFDNGMLKVLQRNDSIHKIQPQRAIEYRSKSVMSGQRCIKSYKNLRWRRIETTTAARGPLKNSRYLKTGKEPCMLKLVKNLL